MFCAIGVGAVFERVGGERGGKRITNDELQMEDVEGREIPIKSDIFIRLNDDYYKELKTLSSKQLLSYHVYALPEED